MQGRAATRLLGLLSSRCSPGGAAALACGERCAAGAAAAGARASHGAAPAAAAAGAVGGLRAWSSAAPPASKSTHNVPLGHQDSDLSSVACHIGLGRRRDLTMREDLGLWKNCDTRLTLAEVFRGAKALLVGFPGGKVCTEQHIPGYIAAIPELKAAGVDKVVCITVGDPDTVRKWAADNGFDKDTALCVLADRDQGFMRALGLELGAEGPACQRFAAVVDNGILLRLKVEHTPGDLKLTHVQGMLKTFKDFFGTN
ncbi:MAG: Redoxin-domain-containing protein [Monoraphidium minutum]|nr:MAG: Redoxin-domain-containing protein [Monoraphidium minutum]